MADQSGVGKQLRRQRAKATEPTDTEPQWTSTTVFIRDAEWTEIRQRAIIARVSASSIVASLISQWLETELDVNDPVIQAAREISDKRRARK